MPHNIDTSSLWQTPEQAKEWVKACSEEAENDVRHLGRYLTFEYDCPKCGLQDVEYTPDYPYCGPNSTWTCKHCYSVMTLISDTPKKGIPKKCMTTHKRNSV